MVTRVHQGSFSKVFLLPTAVSFLYSLSCSLACAQADSPTSLTLDELQYEPLPDQTEGQKPPESSAPDPLEQEEMALQAKEIELLKQSQGHLEKEGNGVERTVPPPPVLHVAKDPTPVPFVPTAVPPKMERKKPEIPPAAIRALQTEKAELAARYTEAQKRIVDLAVQLDDAKMRLMVAETQVERLSRIIEVRDQAVISKYVPDKSAPIPAATPKRESDTVKSTLPRIPSSDVAPNTNSSDIPIATVLMDQTPLRTGPKEENSIIESAQRGTRLAVETRQGSWYRVISPSGTRAWIPITSVAFGRAGKAALTPLPSPTSTPNQDMQEDKALDLIQNR